MPRIGHALREFAPPAADPLPVRPLERQDAHLGCGILTGSQLTSTIYVTDYQDGRFASGIYSIIQTPQAAPVQPVSATYNFTQSYNGTMGVTRGNPGSPSGILFTNGSGWGQRIADPVTGGANTPGTANLNGYFGAYINQGAWTLGSGSLPSPPFGYSSTVAVTQMSGSVSGTLGQTLSGNMTFIGSLLNGTSFSYAGPVSIDNGGYLKFTYGTGTYGNGTPLLLHLGQLPQRGHSCQWHGFRDARPVAGLLLHPDDGHGLRPALAAHSIPRVILGPSPCPAPAGPVPWCSAGASAISAAFSTLIRKAAPPSPAGLGTLASPLVIEGVVERPYLGAPSGNATLTVLTGTSGPFNLSVPGQIGLTPGGSNFIAKGVLSRTTRRRRTPLMSLRSPSPPASPSRCPPSP